MPKFLLQFEGAVIKEIPAKDEITIGRKPDNDVVIDNPAVSSHHCKIVLVGDTYFVEDLNSTNGVFLNAKKIVKSGLQNNDVIGIAKHALKFIDDREQDPDAATVAMYATEGTLAPNFFARPGGIPPFLARPGGTPFFFDWPGGAPFGLPAITGDERIRNDRAAMTVYFM